MKIAIVGSRGITSLDLAPYLVNCDEVVSGGARGVDRIGAAYAKAQGLRLTEFLPDYDKYGRGAPLVRNKTIVEYADRVIAFWDGRSRGTKFVIDYAKKIGKPCQVVFCCDPAILK